MPDDLLPPFRLVACACDDAFSRAILEMTGSLHLAAGCLRCGAVSLMARFAEEPRPHDVQLVGNREEPIAAETRAWLAAWPRVAGSPWRTPTRSFLPGSTRAESVAALEALERTAVEEQAGMTWAERLRRAGPPPGPVPPDVPEDLARPFAGCLRGLALTGDEPLEELLDELARPWSRELVVPLLRARGTSAAEVIPWLRDPSPERRDRGRRAVVALPLASDEVVTVFTAQLDDAATEPHEMHAIAGTLDALGPPARRAAAVLRRQAARLHQSEYYVAKYLGEVARRLGG